MRIEDVESQLEKADTAYHNTGIAIMDDEVYDSLKEYLKKIRPKSKYFTKVGASVKSSQWVKKKHNCFMGSLNKESCLEDLMNWFIPIYFPVVLQEKVDGLSINLVYKNGVCIEAITRGDGEEGEDILRNVFKMKGFQEEIECKDETLNVRAEIMMFSEDFEKYSEIMRDTEQELPKNPRNAASGISRRLDGAFSEFLTLTYIDTSKEFHLETEKWDFLNQNFYDFVVESKTIESKQDVEDIFKEYLKIRPTLPYGIDGLVIKINDIWKQHEMGIVNNRPKGQIAVKFPAVVSETALKGIEISTSRTGRINYVGILEPVYIDGSTVSRASLKNYNEIQRLGIVGPCKVLLKKGGDIIPDIIEKISDIKSDEKWSAVVKKCPVCGSDTEFDGTFFYCSNVECPAVLRGRMIHFLKYHKVKGFSEKFIEKLYDLGKIKYIEDLFTLTKEDFEGIDGIGEKTVTSFLAGIDTVREIDDIKFLPSLGIRGISNFASETLFKNFKGIYSFFDVKITDLASLPRLDVVSATTILTALKKHKEEITDLLGSFIVLKSTAPTSSVLEGLTFCITGDLFTCNRDEMKETIASLGGKVTGSVSKKTSFLINNDLESTSSKNKTANELGVQIINEKDFLKMAGLN